MSHGILRAFADILEYTEASKIIESILDQEKAPDENLTQIA
jgi:ferritin-like metal-binding protein YciE